MSFDPITFAMAKAYTDSKGGYVEQGKEIFNIALTDGANFEVAAAGNELTVGETYTVITESGSFSAVCKDFNEGALLGNLASIYPSGENTGESFAVFVGVDMGEAFCVAVDQNGGSFIKVSTPETVHTIDPKYLPSGIGGGLPTVELGTVLTLNANGISLSDKDQAALDTIGGNPCVIRFSLDTGEGGIPVSTFLTTFYIEGVLAIYTAIFSIGAGPCELILMEEEDGSGWTYTTVGQM